MTDTDELIAELEITLRMIERQIVRIHADAKSRNNRLQMEGDIVRNIDIHSIQDVNGNYLVTPLLIAKAQCLAVLIPLRSQKEAQAKLEESLAGVKKFFQVPEEPSTGE